MFKAYDSKTSEIKRRLIFHLPNYSYEKNPKRFNEPNERYMSGPQKI